MSDTLRILHCLRAPVGGLFRHVCDLVAAQSAMEHAVGVICDSTTGGDFAESRLASLAEQCSLGLHRFPMNRQIGLSDFTATVRVRRLARDLEADVVHGHGAKGGAYARLAVARLKKKRGQQIACFYTPHGGSLHYSPDSMSGRVFLSLERRLGPKTDGIIFESTYSSGLYEQKVGAFPCATEIIPNGLAPDEFVEPAIDINAADFLFIGELRHLKGVDVLLDALSVIAKSKPDVTAFIVGAGPDETTYKRLASRLKLDRQVTFAGPMPAGAAFTRGRCLVMPSRAESFPYIVLEAAAARMPLIATNVGGIPEITAGTSCELIQPGNVSALVDKMNQFLETPDVLVGHASELQNSVSKRFTIDRMSQSITQFYRRILEESAPA